MRVHLSLVNHSSPISGESLGADLSVLGLSNLAPSRCGLLRFLSLSPRQSGSQRRHGKVVVYWAKWLLQNILSYRAPLFHADANQPLSPLTSTALHELDAYSSFSRHQQYAVHI
jgi:hypothetical protein